VDQAQPTPFGEPAPGDQGGGWGQQQGGWGQQGGYDEVDVDQGAPPNYSSLQGTGTVTREVEGGFDAKVGKLVGLVKQMPFPARLGIVVWAAVVILLLSPLGGFLPLVDAANGKIEAMSIERGVALAELVGSKNVKAIVDRKNVLIDTRFLDGRTGVKFAMVTDSQGVILSPPERSGQTLEKHPAYIQSALEGGVGRSWEGELLELMVPIKASTREGAPITTVGYSYLLYDAKDVAGMVGSLTLRAVMSILLLIAVGVAIFGAVWRIAVVPVAQLREETELAVKGHQPKVVATVPWRQLEELAHSINRAVKRMHGHAPEQEPAAAAGPDPRVGSLLLASGFPVLLIDDQLRIEQLNAAAAYMLGVAEDGAIGSNVIDLLPDRDIGAKLRRMLDAIGGGQGNVFSDMAVLSGQERRVTVAGEPGDQGGAPRYSVVVIT
jgi:PAS domain-containing protein